MAKFIKYLAIPSIFFVFLFSCKKDGLSEDASIKLQFSTDTLYYDTLFTTLGSVTQTIKIYNTSNSDIKIASINLAKGASSNFAVNINGTNSSTFNNLLLRAKDSLFMFVKVTINPNMVNAPFLITDEIKFTTNTNFQSIQLVAWGKNAYFHKAKPGFNAIYIDSSTTLLTDKPHVFLNNVILNYGNSLTLNKNCKLHFKANTGLIIEPNCTLNILGDLNEEVEFSGINLNADLLNTPGQWNGITFINININSTINYAIIKNAKTALAFINENNLGNNIIKIDNTIIQNHSETAIQASNSSINASNLVVTNSFLGLLNLSKNGTSNFTHCSFGNYWDLSNRNNPLLTISESAKANFTNCILFGELKEELEISNLSNTNFKNCILKTTKVVLPPTFVNCIGHLDAGFKNVPLNDYSLSSGSPAINNGDSTLIGFTKDILQNNRNGITDIGAYEFTD